MGLARFSEIPVRRARTAVLDVFSSRFIFIPLFILFAAACLLLTGCTDEEVIGPGDGGNDDPDDPICPLDAPWVEIVAPDVGDSQYYPPRMTFRWEQDPEYMIAYTRHLIVELEPGETGTDMINEYPEQFDDYWTEWKQWDPAGESAEIGRVSPLDDGTYFFAVQAIDSCGSATDSFSCHNTRQFTVRKIYPLLTLKEPILGIELFSGTEYQPPAALILPRLILNFSWHADPTFEWFGPIEYRYGWDIQNLDDDEQWMISWSSYATKESHPRSVFFNAGVHVFYLEARDKAGTITRARIEIEVIEFTKERDLLWIDDMLLYDTPLPLRHLPTETEHDEFWTGICSLAPGFDPARDIYEADIYDRRNPVPLEVLAKYKSVIWTSDRASENVWSSTIEFKPFLDTERYPTPNNLKIYMAATGNVLSCGMGDMSGSSLSAVFPDDPAYPASVVHEIAGYHYDFDYARLNMAHDDYYVSVIDKVLAPFKTDLPGDVYRNRERDAMTMALKDCYAPLLPDTLRLWDEITQPGMFFDPMVRGFFYVEAYDPEYYMDYTGVISHECFSPIYRMKSRSTLSPLNGAAVALWTMDQDCEYDPDTNPYSMHYPGSAHFGFPLWFIDHGQVEMIAEYLYHKWGID